MLSGEEALMGEGLQGKVVVITGASSGIGRTTALMLARRGARLVLAARRKEPLESLGERCEALGAACLVVPTDVSNEEDVEALAEAAQARFGPLHGWVNNAGVYAVGPVLDTPTDVFRRVMEVNYFGVLHGTRAAVRRMRGAPGRGVVVNVASQLASVGAAYAAAYVASKHAIRGFTSSVRQELLGTGVELCLVMPAAIDTPLFAHSANFSGQALRPPPPVYPPEKVARMIVRRLEHPRPESYVGGAAVVLAAVRPAIPRLFDRLMRSQIKRGQLEARRAEHTRGNLHRPVVEGTGVHGSAFGRTRQWLRRGILGAVALGLGARALRR
jgi:NAD(P)-dependent dehydrogenase (short-subunit alcohol dehydrogenase family)